MIDSGWDLLWWFFGFPLSLCVVVVGLAYYLRVGMEKNHKLAFWINDSFGLVAMLIPRSKKGRRVIKYIIIIIVVIWIWPDLKNYIVDE